MVRSILLISAILATASVAAPTGETGSELALETAGVGGHGSNESKSIQKRSFAASCRGCSLGLGTMFICYCSATNGVYYASSVNLDHCLGNADGWITWRSLYENSYLLLFPTG